MLKEYEVVIESIDPCGGEQHARKEILEVEAGSPEAYVKEKGRFPIREIIRQENGDVTIITGDDAGYIVRYTFSE